MSSDPAILKAPEGLKGLIGAEGDGLDSFAREYLLARWLLSNPSVGESHRPERKYDDTEALWQALMRGGPPYEAERIVLRRVWLTEWVPRSPGTYLTEEAAGRRALAERFVLERTKSHILYDPYGKLEMIKGGVGCHRLNVKGIGGERLKFLSASSEGVSHAGFVVAVREEAFGQLSASVCGAGALFCDIIGRIRGWSGSPTVGFRFDEETPKFYLIADDVQPAAVQVARTTRLTATAAIMFMGVVDRREGCYFTFISFDPRDGNELKKCIKWLKSNYVEGRYSGRVLTDFDERGQPFFNDVRFPIKKLMDTRSSNDELQQLATSAFGISPETAEAHLSVVHIGVLNVDQSQNKNIDHSIGKTVNIDQSRGKKVEIDQSTGKTVHINQIFFDSRLGSVRWRQVRQFMALASGLAMIVMVIAIAIKMQKMSDALYTFLRIALALGGAAFAMCIDGFLTVKFRTWIRATGGFAVFVIIYFWPVSRPTSSTAAPDPSPAAQASSSPSAR